jgi:hypothetical protein
METWALVFALARKTCPIMKLPAESRSTSLAIHYDTTAGLSCHIFFALAGKAWPMIRPPTKGRIVIRQERTFVNEKGEEVTILVAYVKGGISITITRNQNSGDPEAMSKLERAVLRNMLDPTNMIEGRRRVPDETPQ